MMVLRIVSSPAFRAGRRSAGCARPCLRADDSRLIAAVSDLSGRSCDDGAARKVSKLMHPRLTVAVALMFAGAILAGSAARADSKRDQDMTRQAVERGEIKPLADILAAIRSKLPGEVVGVEIEQKRGRWFYEFRVADPKGRLFEVYVDAGSGAIDRIKEK
jgi:uncharacterized membrane protein YkoI